MIDPKAEPIANRTPYKPVDLRPKWRKREWPEAVKCQSCQYEYDDWPHCPRCGD